MNNYDIAQREAIGSTTSNGVSIDLKLQSYGK